MPNSNPRDYEGRTEPIRSENDDHFEDRSRNDDFDEEFEDSSRVPQYDRGRSHGRRGDRYASRQALLNIVNHVLNEEFPDKAIFSDHEFFQFLKYVEDEANIRTAADRRGYAEDLETSPDKTLPADATDEEVFQFFCDYARDLYFFAGGTLICAGSGRKGCVDDGDPPLYPFRAITEHVSGDETEPEPQESAPLPPSRFVRDNIIPHFTLIFDVVQKTTSRKVADWNDHEYVLFSLLAQMKFCAPDLDNNTFQNVALSGLGGATKIFKTFDELLLETEDVDFEFSLSLPNLEKLFSWVDRKVNFNSFPPGAVFEGVLYGLNSFLSEIVGGNFANTTESDRKDALLAVARYVLKATSFAHREFHDDLVDFADFGKELVRVGGSGAGVPVEIARHLFFEAGGELVEEEVVEPEPETKEPWKKSRADLIKKILVEEFPDGMDLYSEAALETFRSLGREYAVDFFEEPNDDRLRGVLSRPSLTWQGKLHVLPESAKRRLENVIDGVLDLQAKTIYYDALFEKNRATLESLHIHDPLLLRSLIAFYFSRYFFYEHYFEPELSSSSELSKLTREILRGWGRDEELTAEELAGRVYVDVELIDAALEIDVNHFESRGDGFYARVPETTRAVARAKKLDDQFCRATSRTPNEQGLNGKEFIAALANSERENDEPLFNPYVSAAEPSPKSKQKESSGSARAKSDSDSRKSDWAEKMELLEGMPSINVFGLVDAAPKPKSAKAAKAESKAASRTSEEKPAKRAATKAVEPAKELSAEELKARKKNIADAISTFDGLKLGDAKELALFRERAAEKGVVFSDDDEDVLKEIQRVGFVCDDRLYVISKKTKERLCKVATDWFAQGGRMIYYVAFVEKGSDWLAKAGISNVSVLKNRFQKYVPGCFFHDEYFEIDGDEEFAALSEQEKVKEEILRVWDGGSSKRVSELVDALFVPRDKIEEVLKNDPGFTSRSNGYWSQEKTSGSRKRSASPKRKSSKKRPS